MPIRLRAAGLLWPTLMTLLGVAVLIGLGTWQLQRKVWKESLVAAVAERTKAEPVPIARVPAFPADNGLGPEYLRIRAAGRFLHGQERHVYNPAQAGPGWNVITPLLLDDGTMVLVNRGWVPDALKDPASRTAGQIVGRMGVIGLVRKPELAASFTPDNSPERNTWFWRDLDAMSACRNGTAGTPDCQALTGAERYPFFVDAEAEPANPGGWPKGGTTNLEIPNRHLEYVLTWYGLAVTLIAVYLAYAGSRLRGRDHRRVP